MFLSILIGWIINRAKEPSTYAGIGAVVAGASQTVPSDLSGSIQYIVMGVCGIVAVVMKEKASW